MAVWPLSSTLSLPTLALPAYSDAMVSMVGPIWRHGPHHSAQKSTSTGSGDLSTSLSNAASVKVNVLLPAISKPPFVLDLVLGQRMQPTCRHPAAADTGPHIRTPQPARNNPYACRAASWLPSLSGPGKCSQQS